MILYISLGFMLCSLGKALQTAENSTFILQQTSSWCQRQKNKRGQWAVSDPLIGGGGAVEEAEQFPRRNKELLSVGRIWACLTGQTCARNEALWGFMKAPSPAASQSICEHKVGFLLQTFTLPIFYLITPKSDTLWRLEMSFLWFGEGEMERRIRWLWGGNLRLISIALRFSTDISFMY